VTLSCPCRLPLPATRQPPALPQFAPTTKYRVRASKLEDGTVEKSELELVLLVADTCRQLQVEKILVADIWELKQNLEVAATNDIELPAQHKCAVARRLLSAQLPDMDTDSELIAWAQRAWPWSEASAALPWQISAPAFAKCAPKESTSQQDLKAFAESWHATIFNDDWMRAWTDAGSDGASPQRLIKLADSFMTVFASSAPPPEWAADVVWQPVVHIMRGIVAICCPTPGLHGASLKDVEYLIPEAKTSPMLNSISKVGRILLNHVKTDKLWTARKESYISVAGAEATHGRKVAKATCTAKEVVYNGDGLSAEHLQQKKDGLLTMFVKEHPSWQTALRPQATDQLQELVMKIVEADWRAAKADNKCMVGSLGVWVSVLQTMTLPESRALLQTIEERLQQMQFESAAAALQEVAKEFSASPSLSLCPSFLQSIKAASSLTEVGKEILADWEGAIKETFGIMEAGVADDWHRALVGIWHAVQQSKFLPDLHASCAKWESASQPMLSVRGAQAEYKKAESDADDSRTSAALEIFLNTYTTSLSHYTKLAAADPPKEKAEIFADFVAASRTFMIDTFEKEIKEGCAAIENGMLAKLRVATHALSQIAGGAAAGESWHSAVESASDVLGCFRQTLDKVDIKQIIKRQSVVTKATATAAAHTAYLYSANFPRGLPGWPAVPFRHASWLLILDS
jgi:hypothetical protein